MQAKWNWGIFFEQAPFGNVTYFSWLVDGFLTTAALFVCAWIVAFVAGSLFGILRTLPSRLFRTIGAAYVAIFRNIPLIVQFFIWYLSAPDLLPHDVSVWFKAELNPNIQFFILSTCALGFFTGARVCEQVRSGIQALSSGQRSAALALGLTLPQTYLYVLLPNAYRIIIPPLTSEMLNMVKNTAVASTIGLVELTSQANRLLEFSGYAYESFIAVTLAYVLLNFVVMRAMKLLENKMRLPSVSMGGKNA